MIVSVRKGRYIYVVSNEVHEDCCCSGTGKCWNASRRSIRYRDFGQGSNILAVGRNHVLAHHDPTDHGEVNAIRKACKKLGTHDLSGCTLYTNAIPCPMCLSAIIWANITTCYYGNNRKDAKDIGFRDDYIYNFIEGGLKDKDVLDISQHDRDMTIKAFNDFKADVNSTIY